MSVPATFRRERILRLHEQIRQMRDADFCAYQASKELLDDPVEARMAKYQHIGRMSTYIRILKLIEEEFGLSPIGGIRDDLDRNDLDHMDEVTVHN